MPTAENSSLNSESVIADQRIALCLSGGGFRAALFHLGALRRLNELGVLSKINTIASVSGGSILAGHLATRLRPRIGASAVPPSKYRPDVEGYSKELAETVIARVRTDMDAFSDAEIAVLENHGYLLADIAVEVHAPQLKTISAPKRIPNPEYFDEAKVRAALGHSHERRWFGRK